MSVVGSTLMKRGFEAHAYMSEKQVRIEMPPWVIAILTTTLVVFCFALFSIEYTFGRVIPTLVMIESPQETLQYEPLPTQNKDINKEPEPVSAQPRFITSSFHSAIRHLKSKDGFRGRFRGVWIFVAHNLAVQWLANFLSNWTSGYYYVPLGVFYIAASVMCAQLSLGWTLIVITERSPKFWFQRLPSFRVWKKAALATALFAVAEQVAVMIPHYLASRHLLRTAPEDIPKLPAHEQNKIILTSFGIIISWLCISLLMVLPANIALTRVQASLVSDTEETVVPFDRTFDGKVVPEVVGGSGVVGIFDAFKTFDWSARVRLVKAYIKVVAMFFATTIFFSVALAVELLIFSSKIHKVVVVPADGN